MARDSLDKEFESKKNISSSEATKTPMHTGVRSSSSLAPSLLSGAGAISSSTGGRLVNERVGLGLRMFTSCV